MIDQLYTLFGRHPKVVTDTRRIESNSIFFALRGESFDGNNFAIKALEAGASYSVVDRAEIATLNPEFKERLIMVDDVLTTLQELARHHRRVLGVEVLAISGSNGKTTTKELISRVLSRKYRHLHATVGNFNNHIGVPLTLLAMRDECDFTIVEMGASSCGEIELLCEIAEPNYGVLTNVGRAHLEGFGGEEGVRRGKGELFDFLAKTEGVAFIPSENATISEMASEREGLRCEEYSYALGEGVESNLEGEYNRFNIAAAVAIGRFFGVGQEQTREAIASYKPENNRSQRVETANNTLIMDCYNANPSSMQAALNNFMRETFPSATNKCVILGDMLELGEWSEAEHLTVVERLLDSDIEHIYLVGKEFSRVAKRGERVTVFETREIAEEALKNSPMEGCAILLKGSRGVGLEKITKYL